MKIALELTKEQVDLVVAVLGKQPAEVSFHTLMAIHLQMEKLKDTLVNKPELAP